VTRGDIFADDSWLQLLSIVPHIIPLATLYPRYNRERSIPNSLLLYTTAYLSALALSPEEHYDRLRDDLAAGVDAYCGLLYLSQAPEVAAVQALDLLANFAPLGVLPCRSVSAQTIVVARGHIANALCLSRSIGLDINTRSDVWTWLSVCATTAMYKLEDWACCGCSEIFEAQTLSDIMIGMVLTYDQPEYLAQITLCERIARLAIVFEALASFKHALQSSIDNVFYDAQSEITKSLCSAKKSFGATHDRFRLLYGESQLFDSLTIDLAGHSRTSSVRDMSLNIRRLFEEGKVQRGATISFIAAALVRESLVDLADEYQVLMYTPEELKQKKWESAMSLASDPHNITQWFRRNLGSPACVTINSWAGDRVDGVEEMFVVFGEPDPSVDRCLAPWQHIASIMVEGTNVLLDLQAAHLVNTGSAHSRRQAQRMSRRVYLMRQVSRTMRGVEGRRTNTISAMCSDLIGSMARIYENRTIRLNDRSGLESTNTQEVLPTADSDYEVFKRLCAFLNEPC
jgi:hypothetical protein